MNKKIMMMIMMMMMTTTNVVHSYETEKRYSTRGARGRARRARRPFSSNVPHRLEQPTPPYELYSVPHGPHEVRRAVLAGRVARADPGGAPARARPARRPSERCTSCPSYPPCTARAGALRVPGEGVSACVLRGALHRATRGVVGFARFAHCLGLRSPWSP